MAWLKFIGDNLLRFVSSAPSSAEPSPGPCLFSFFLFVCVYVFPVFVFRVVYVFFVVCLLVVVVFLLIVYVVLLVVLSVLARA